MLNGVKHLYYLTKIANHVSPAPTKKGTAYPTNRPQHYPTTIPQIRFM